MSENVPTMATVMRHDTQIAGHADRGSPRNAAARVLVVEDYPDLVEVLTGCLGDAGLETLAVGTVHDAHELLRRRDVDVAVLDLTLPDGSGLDLMRDLESRAIPVLVLTGRDDRETRLASFRAGASDYITKPFDLEELVYRVRVALRRRVGVETPLLSGPAGIALDIEGQRLLVGGEVVSLSRMQFLVLRELLERRGDVVTANELSRSVWGHQTFDSRNYVELQVSRLRQRLSAAGAIRVIETIRGVGYVIR